MFAEIFNSLKEQDFQVKALELLFKEGAQEAYFNHQLSSALEGKLGKEEYLVVPEFQKIDIAVLKINECNLGLECAIEAKHFHTDSLLLSKNLETNIDNCRNFENHQIKAQEFILGAVLSLFKHSEQTQKCIVLWVPTLEDLHDNKSEWGKYGDGASKYFRKNPNSSHQNQLESASNILKGLLEEIFNGDRGSILVSNKRLFQSPVFQFYMVWSFFPNPKKNNLETLKSAYEKLNNRRKSRIMNGIETNQEINKGKKAITEIDRMVSSMS